MSSSLRLTACLATLLVSSAPALAQRSTDPLAPIVQCLRAGQFSTLEQKRLPSTATSRTVETAAGTKAISTLDGYSLLLATPQGLPFVNVKVELSAAAQAAADRDAVTAQMQTFASRRTPEQRDLTRRAEAGVDVLSLHQPDLTRGGPISLYSFFVPEKDLIGTAYVLNQDPAKRAFSTYTEYEALRDEAARLVQACITPGKA